MPDGETPWMASFQAISCAWALMAASVWATDSKVPMLEMPVE